MSAVASLVSNSLRCAHEIVREHEDRMFCVDCGLSWGKGETAREAIAVAVESELREAYRAGLFAAQCVVEDDAFAITFQDLARYRLALIRHLRECANPSEPHTIVE